VAGGLPEGICDSELVIFENSSQTAFIGEQTHYVEVVDDFLSGVDATARGK
jgi:hypothetical protein